MSELSGSALDPERSLQTAAPISLGRLLLFGGLAGLLAGLLAWAIGEQTQAVFVPKISYIEAFGSKTPKIDRLDQIVVDYKNALVVFGILGASLGLCMGLSSGLVRGSSSLGIKAGILGLIVGALITSGAAAAILPIYFHADELDQEKLSQDLVLPLLIHAGCWGAAGLAGGLVFGWGLQTNDREGRNRPGRAAIGGLVGAVLGAVVYEVIGGFLFVNDKTGEPISRTVTTRLLARVAVALLAGLTAALMVNSQPKPVKPTANQPLG